MEFTGGEKIMDCNEATVIIVQCIFRFVGLLVVCFTAGYIAGLIW